MERFYLMMCIFFMSLFSVQASPSDVIDISASSFKLDVDTQLLRAVGPVVVTCNGVQIEGREALYDHLSESVVMDGGITVMHKELVITCSRAVLKGLEEWVSLEEGVSIIFGNELDDEFFSVQSYKGVYYLAENRLEAQGGARFLRGDEYIEGNQLVVDLEPFRVVANGSAKVILSY